ncbi:MAG: pyridoxine 5'-phosphate synthase, partial [Verrucomicrobiota bacterium]
LHTGAFANVSPEGGESEFQLLKESCLLAHSLGLQVNAGHGITLMNLPKLMQLPNLAELNVGHHLVSRAMFIGLGRAVREMKTLMGSYPQLSGQIGEMS